VAEGAGGIGSPLRRLDRYAIRPSKGALPHFENPNRGRNDGRRTGKILGLLRGAGLTERKQWRVGLSHWGVTPPGEPLTSLRPNYSPRIKSRMRFLSPHWVHEEAMHSLMRYVGAGCPQLRPVPTRVGYSTKALNGTGSSLTSSALPEGRHRQGLKGAGGLTTPKPESGRTGGVNAHTPPTKGPDI
jgi:hypothetical protein